MTVHHSTTNDSYEVSRTLDDLITSANKPRDLLGQLCWALLTHQGDDDDVSSHSDAISRVFSPRASRTDSQFYAAAFLRLLSNSPNDVHLLDPPQRLHVIRLFDTLPAVATALNIDEKRQSYDKLGAFEKAATQAETYLEEALARPHSLRDIRHARQKVMRVYNNSLVNAVVTPFLPSFLSKSAISDILRILYDHTGKDSRGRADDYIVMTNAITAKSDACHEYDTHYVRKYFQPFFAALLLVLKDDHQSSSFSQPASLSLNALGKRYPFAVSDVEVPLIFVVKNESSGIALDVQLSIESDALSLPSPSQFLDQLDAGERLEPVEFRATAVDPTDQPVEAICTLTWNNTDGSPGSVTELIELQAQPSNIPWTKLSHAEPYSLEPVTNVRELIGRSKQTTMLVSKMTAPSVGSFFIYGQRRVGKTSVVATLDDRAELKSVTIIRLETGDFAVPDAQETINSLGNTICSTLLRRNDKLSRLKRPHFTGALAPLSNFLSDAFDHDPMLRLVIVLDEFDALPPALYRLGDISHAFFTTIRSLSAKPPLGFVLVGGETMHEILSNQGIALNKFRVLRIDYLEKDSHWSDFVELVRRPVRKWVEITDNAITTLYDVTAGNPFFTKFVCAELFDDIKERRDAHATAVDMRRAIATAVRQAGIHQFQHFWQDGVVATNQESIAHEQALRRRVLLSLGNVLRASGQPTIENIKARASRFALDEAEVRSVLDDFVQRKVLVRREGQYSCKVRLFQRWLVDEGVHQLNLTLVEEEGLRRKMEAEEEQRVKDREIKSLVDSWGYYRGRPITEPSLRAWLEQFENSEEQRLIFTLLKGVQFYSGSMIRAKLKEGHESVIGHLAARGVARAAAQDGARKVTDNVVISYYGNDGKRGHRYAKLYADENSIYSRRIVRPSRLRKTLEDLNDVEGIVFVDDFIGTGGTAERALNEVLEQIHELVSKRQIDVFLVLVSGFSKAANSVRDKLSKQTADAIDIQVRICDPLDEDDRCFSERSTLLPEITVRSRTREVVEVYGRMLVPRHPLGFGNCQALVVFEDTCPNNSLPILWADSPDKKWQPLFARP